MRFYEVTKNGNCEGFYPTQAHAHDHAKSVHTGKVYIDEVEVPTDKDGLLALLNTPATARLFPTLRTWTLTPRGGMAQATTRGTEELNIDDGNAFDPQDAPDDLWLAAAEHFNLDADQFSGDDAMRRVVISAHRRLLDAKGVTAGSTLGDNDPDYL